MGEKDYDKILYVKFIIVMEGGYNRIRLDDLIIDDKGYKWKVLWKTGSHALIESQGNIEPENYDKIININGRRIAILSEKYLIK